MDKNLLTWNNARAPGGMRPEIALNEHERLLLKDWHRQRSQPSGLGRLWGDD